MPQIEGPSYLILFVWVMAAVLGVMSCITSFWVVRFINKTDKKFSQLFSDNTSLKHSMQFVKTMMKQQKGEIKELREQVKQLKRRGD